MVEDIFTASCISRRLFLRNAGMALAAGAVFPAIIPARALGRDGAVAPSNRVTLGLVGTSQGMVNLERCLPLSGVQAVAVCDTDAKRLAKAVRRVDEHYEAKGTRGYEDFREMFAKAGLDAVILAAPDHWHGIMAVAALRAGIDVYGEKPLAHTLAEGRAIVDAVKRHGRVWQTGCWQRSIGSFRRVAELVRNGRLGKISRVEVGTYSGTRELRARPADIGKPPAHLAYDLWVGPAQWTDYDSRVTHSNWRWVLNYGGGKLMDWVGHHGDIAQWALGLDATGPVKITGSGVFATTPPYDVEDKYQCECTYANGVVLSISSEFWAGAKFYGERGWLAVTRPRGGVRGGSIEASDPAVLDEVIGEGETQIYRSDDHWQNFIDCVRTRREPIATAEAAQRSASLGHLGHIAIQTGRVIHWDPDTETIQNDSGAAALLQPAFRVPWGI
ncbi:MAG: Gfo/Idh/MocA family oxidoreductase [Puniceicoccales bacterium]|nr:Gfo/Idh/MocA family oxidoreductase [Puniceicoccales bacterium]